MHGSILGARTSGAPLSQFRGGLPEFWHGVSPKDGPATDWDSFGEVSGLCDHVHGGVEQVAYVHLREAEAHPL